MSDLENRLTQVVRQPVLLVASDYDGTVAPIVNDPAAAEANREALVALRMLAELPQTHVAIVSGRALADLAPRVAAAGRVHLVGSHGSEFEAGFAQPLAAPACALLARLTEEVTRIAAGLPGALVERKPASLAFHYRNVPEEQAPAAVAAVLSGPGRYAGVHVRHGRKVVELSVVETDKGEALRRLRRRIGASAVVFIGDDVTDEDAFAALSGPDIGIKVGPGETRAAHRVADSGSVARLLARLAEERAAWVAGSRAVPIEQHALLSDQRTAALVTPGGRITWLCLPRFDSSPVFAELLGGPTAGYFEIRAVGHERALRQHYVGDSFVLQTDWPGFSVVDYLDTGGGRAFQRAGRTDLLRSIAGCGRVLITFAPRLDFGRMATRLRVTDSGVVVEGALDPLVLRVGGGEQQPALRWELYEEGPHQTAHAVAELGSAPLVFELRYGTGNLDAAPLPEPLRRARTERFWSAWAATLDLPSLAPELVRRSALVLKALTYGPTGAMVAAPTTSLPEHAGGVRNWDYRFCWPRDAALAGAALARLGATGPAIKFLDWLLAILDHCQPGSLICPVYTVSGKHIPPEAEIAELSGYRGSRPVRVGNAAAYQIQLDVFGPIAELIAVLAALGAPLSSDHRRMLESMVQAVDARWREADHGIWEIRRGRARHVHSKVMCWQAVDRAIRVARYLGQRRPDWEALREQIAEDILRYGWNSVQRAFCATYDDSEPDAATLWVGLSGLLPPADPRFVDTVDFVASHLRQGPTVFRYRYDDGLPGVEGGFHLCTTWLIEAWARIGRPDAAAALFDEYLKLAGPLGLFAEQYDPCTRQGLGNFPQAYTHLGLINAALCVSGCKPAG